MHEGEADANDSACFSILGNPGRKLAIIAGSISSSVLNRAFFWGGRGSVPVCIVLGLHVARMMLACCDVGLKMGCFLRLETHV